MYDINNLNSVFTKNIIFIKKLINMFLNDNDENSVRNLLFALETDSVFKSLLVDTGIYSVKKHDFLKTPKNIDIRNMLKDITAYIKSAITDMPLTPLYDRLTENYCFINPVSFLFLYISYY